MMISFKSHQLIQKSVLRWLADKIAPWLRWWTSERDSLLANGGWDRGAMVATVWEFLGPSLSFCLSFTL